MNILDMAFASNDFKILQEEIKKDALSKSTLLLTKDSVFAQQFAYALAISILNNGQEEQNENYFKVKALSHPDVKIYPQKDKLLVADSEDIVSECFVKPIFADKKIFIINNIDNSMESAQNKLLKVLEEPPTNVYFILTASNSNLVLPTIRSRCNKVELKKLSNQALNLALQGYSEGKLIASMCDGNIGRGIELAKKDARNIFEVALSVLVKMENSKNVLAFSKKLLSLKGDVETAFEMIGFMLEDILFIKSGRSDKVKFEQAKDQLEKISSDYSVKAICEISSLINKARKEISYNTNTTLVVENLLLGILEVKYICR